MVRCLHPHTSATDHLQSCIRDDEQVHHLHLRSSLVGMLPARTTSVVGISGVEIVSHREEKVLTVSDQGRIHAVSSAFMILMLHLMLNRYKHLGD
jgi:hypothetical protein